MDKNQVPVVTLSNGITVANFSSPHPFTFDDGSVLEACTAERANQYSLKRVEQEINNGRWSDISIRFELTEEVSNGLLQLEKDNSVDVVLVPFPILEAIRSLNTYTKCRTILTVDRVTKVVSSTKFCI